MKKVLYQNKCRINLHPIEDVLKMKKEDLIGRRIIGVQGNNYFFAGKIIDSKLDDMTCFYNYTDHKISSLLHLMETEKEKLNFDEYGVYPEFVKSAESRTSAYEAVRVLEHGIIYVIFLDEYEFLIDAPDEPFKDNVINLLTFDPEIDYYSRGQVYAIADNATVENRELQTLQFHPKCLVATGHFIELATYEFFDSVKYLNYHFNFEYFVNGEKLEELSYK